MNVNIKWVTFAFFKAVTIGWITESVNQYPIYTILFWLLTPGVGIGVGGVGGIGVGGIGVGGVGVGGVGVGVGGIGVGGLGCGGVGVVPELNTKFVGIWPVPP